MKQLITGFCMLAVALPALGQQDPAHSPMTPAAPKAGEHMAPEHMTPEQAPAAQQPAEHMPAGDMPAGDMPMAQPAEASANPGAAPMEEQAGFSRGSVMRSAFTTVIEDREPAEDLTTLPNAVPRVMYFTELRDMEGQTATHRWEYNGQVMAEVKFKVRGPRWRVWSSKNLVPGWTGKWKVSVLNAAGEVIAEDELAYVEAPAQTPAPAPAEAPAPAAAAEAAMPETAVEPAPAD